MSVLAEKLKKRAADFEAKRQIDKAISAYLDLFRQWDVEGGTDVDVALFNRAGDLLVREGSIGEAVSVWERAVDFYSESGFHNNAIALCNKILRYSPGRASIYYKLGRISALKGFRGDARKNFLEYADRMRAADNPDEAFRALKEFADLCPDEDEVRQMLADQLTTAGRKAEAIEQLQVLYERYETLGDSTAAGATFERIKAIDPDAEPRRDQQRATGRRSGLVFIDLDKSTPDSSRRVTPPSEPAQPSTSFDNISFGETFGTDAIRELPQETFGAILPTEEDDALLERFDEPAQPTGDPFSVHPFESLDPAIDVDSAVDHGVSYAHTSPPADGRPHYRSVEQGGTGAGGRRRATDPSLPTLAHSVEALRERARRESTNWDVQRAFGEALLEAGDRRAGLDALERAMTGFERTGNLDSARSVADEIVRLQPHSIRSHQKRVEYAFRAKDRTRLIDAYLELADALFRAGETEKAQAVYRRVVELAPGEARARAALSSHTTAEQDRRFVSLAEWTSDQRDGRSTRMVVNAEEPSGDEQADFSETLRKFKEAVAANVDVEDHESHYDLGVAYREMGLLDEAIAEFQTALRGARNRVRAYEALGQCFVDRGQHRVAATLLQRALQEPGAGDDQLVGVLYLLGISNEALQQPADAVKYYQRIFAVDINFRDVQERLVNLDQAAQ
jgi:tetratricopeptide (TPR) repeat protein